MIVRRCMIYFCCGLRIGEYGGVCDLNCVKKKD